MEGERPCWRGIREKEGEEGGGCVERGHFVLWLFHASCDNIFLTFSGSFNGYPFPAHGKTK